MANILHLAKDDIRRLFSSMVSIIITLGLIVLPSVFTWYNVLACWNVFDNTDKLTVAVANTDEGYSSELIAIPVNLGDQVVSVLHESDKMNWVFVDEGEAIDGARAGRYYAAVVIPKNFSQALFTFFEEDSSPAQIRYYTNEKKNAVAPKLTDQGTNTMSYQVNQVFAEVLTEAAALAAQSMADLTESPYVQADISNLITHVRQTADSIDSFATLSSSFEAILISSHGLLNSAENLTNSVENSAQSISSSLDETTAPLNSMGQGLQASVDDLSLALSANTDAYDALIESVENFFASAETTQDSARQVLSDLSTDLYHNAQYYEDVANYLTDLANELPDDLPNSNLEPLNKVQNQLLTTANKIYDVSSTFEYLAATIESAVPATDLSADNPDIMVDEKNIGQILEDVKDSVTKAQATFDEEVQTTLSNLAAKAEEATAKINETTTSLGMATDSLSGTVATVDKGITAAQNKISDVGVTLAEVATKMREGADDLEAALASGQNSLVQSLLQTNIESLATFASSPVGVTRIAVYPVDNFGSAMAPLYSSLALFIGALLITVGIKPQPCAQQRKALPTLTATQSYLGHFSVFGFISLMQSTLLSLGNMLFLGVQVLHPFLYLLCFWVAGLVFSFIIYTLVVSFANLGKAIAVILLVVQVTGCGGSFPLQILPTYVQIISPYLPATHAVNAMRSAMMGIFANDYWFSLGKLCLFIIPMLLLGLILRRPLEKFMTWYLEKVESSKLIG